MLNRTRLTQFLHLMERSEWDLLLFYGDGWRKDFVRSLIGVGYAGSNAIAGLTRSGDLFGFFVDPWDFDAARVSSEGDVTLHLTWDLTHSLRDLPYAHRGSRVAVAGLELMESRFVDALVQRCGHPLQPATAAAERLRTVKSANEIAALRRAARLADLGYRCFVDTLAEGLAEHVLVAEVEAVLKTNGAEDNFMLLAAGGPEVRAMRPATDRQFRKGDCVPTELTPQVHGQFAQLCRTTIVGQPTDAQIQAFDIFLRAQQAAETLLGPGVMIADVARVQNDVFREAGFGEFTSSSYTRVRGHGLGFFVDDRPQILEDVDWMVEENMVLIPHPNTYLPTVGYMVFGDALVVTASGCERLGETEKRLFHT